MFDLVADVEQYPRFVPWWAAARITRRSSDSYETDQVLRFGLVQERFATRTTLERPRRIDVTSDDPSFQSFWLCWRFEPEPNGGCRIVLETEIEFRSRLKQRIFDLVLVGSPEAIVDAFEKRARACFGDPAPAPQSGQAPKPPKD